MLDKSSYRLLIVAYGASLLQILTFVKNLKKENSSVAIDLLTDLKMDLITGQIKDYVTRVYRIRKILGRFSHDRAALIFNKCLFIASFFVLSFKKYDIVNIHFARPSLLKAMPWIRRMTKNIVITPWGSDVLRVEDENAIKRMREVYRYASIVTVQPDSQSGVQIAEKFQLSLVPTISGTCFRHH